MASITSLNSSQLHAASRSSGGLKINAKGLEEGKLSNKTMDLNQRKVEFKYQMFGLAWFTKENWDSINNCGDSKPTRTAGKEFDTDKTCGFSPHGWQFLMGKEHL